MIWFTTFLPWCKKWIRNYSRLVIIIDIRFASDIRADPCSSDFTTEADAMLITVQRMGQFSMCKHFSLMGKNENSYLLSTAHARPLAFCTNTTIATNWNRELFKIVSTTVQRWTLCSKVFLFCDWSTQCDRWTRIPSRSRWYFCCSELLTTLHEWKKKRRRLVNIWN